MRERRLWEERHGGGNSTGSGIGLGDADIRTQAAVRAETVGVSGEGAGAEAAGAVGLDVRDAADRDGEDVRAAVGRDPAGKRTRNDDGLPRHDLRRYIRPGDMVTYISRKAALKVDDLNSRYGCRCTVMAETVYRDFVVTRLGRTGDCVNRWDIEEVNGKSFEMFVPQLYAENIYAALRLMRRKPRRGRERSGIRNRDETCQR